MSIISEQNKSPIHLCKLLGETDACQFQTKLDHQGGRGTKTVVWFFDLKLSGEAATCPKQRLPAFVAENARRDITLSLGANDKLGKGHVHVWFLAGNSVGPQIKHMYVCADSDKT